MKGCALHTESSGLPKMSTERNLLTGLYIITTVAPGFTAVPSKRNHQEILQLFR